MKRRISLSFGLCVGLCVSAVMGLVGCGMPTESGSTVQKQSSVVQSSDISRYLKAPSTTVSGLQPSTSPHSPRRASSGVVLGSLPSMQPEVDWMPGLGVGPASFDLRQDTSSIKASINYPNLHICGLKFHSNAGQVWTAVQAQALLAELSLSPVSPSAWGSRDWDIPAPTLHIVEQNGQRHIELRIQGPMLYVTYMRLQTKSKSSWRQFVQSNFGSMAVSISIIGCPSRP